MWAKSVAVTVSSVAGCEQFVEGGVNFDFYQTPSISALLPASGWAGAAMAVTVTGSNFLHSASLMCRFGLHAPLQATFRSESVVLCAVPLALVPAVQEALPVVLEVSNNGLDFTSDGHFFSLTPPTVLHHSDPPMVAVGVAATITIHGSHFVDCPEAKCLYDNTTYVFATVVSASVFTCPLSAPDQATVSACEVRLPLSCVLDNSTSCGDFQ